MWICLDLGSVSVIVSLPRRPYEYVDPGKEVDITDFSLAGSQQEEKTNKRELHGHD